MSILFVQAPLVVNQCLATRIGLNEAIALQQVHYWVQRGTSGVEHEGRRWIYNTLDEWGEQFPFWSRDQIKRIFASLKKQGVLSIEQLRKKDHDRTNFYAVDYDHELLEAAEINERAKSPIRAGEIAPSMGAESPRRTAENRPVDGCKSAPSMGANPPRLTETTTENTTETSTDTLPAAQQAPAASKRKKSKAFGLADLMNNNPHGIAEQVLSDWLQSRKASRAAVSETVWLGILRELAKCADAGISPESALIEAVMAGWRGFKFEWVQNRLSANNTRHAATNSYDCPKCGSHMDDCVCWAETINEGPF